mgnify:FL=1
MRLKLFGGYPYHENKKELVQKLIDFPFQFYSKSPRDLVKNQSLVSQITDKNLHPGFLKAYETIIEKISSGQEDDLKDLVEFNLYKKVLEICKNYREQGYSFRSSGSIDETEAFLVKTQSIKGSVLPFRNLNFPLSYYEKLSLFPLQKEEFEFTDISFAPEEQVQDPPENFSEFLNTDFKHLNETGDYQAHYSTLKRLFTLLNKYRIDYIVMDVAISSTYKLQVYKDDQLVEGSPDPSEKEFHCMRLECMEYMPSWVISLLNLTSQKKKFLNNCFQGIAGQFTIVDVDGFMNGNPLIKNK